VIGSTDLRRFWRHVLVQPDGCWQWTGGLSGPGYGNFFCDGRTRSAHRFAYTMFVEPIADGLDIDHLCRNRACVNPDHLEAVSRQENLHRGAGPGGVLAPTRNFRPLVEYRSGEQLVPLWLSAHRKARGLSQIKLAALVGVTPPMISHIETGKRQPSRTLLRRLAQALDVAESALATGVAA
jgi:DNA-binding XRE family transcriptional regulator